MPKHSEWNCIHLNSGRPPSVLNQGHITAAGEYSSVPGSVDEALLVLVPADRCNTIALELPELNERKLQLALRWAAEDAIAGPIEEQHVAPVQREADGRLRCVVSSRQDMQQWLNSLPKRPLKMLPDAACLPWKPGQMTLLSLDSHWLVRWAQTGFDRIEADLLDLMLPELISASEQPPTIVCYLAADEQTLPDALAAFKPEKIALEKNALALLAKHAVDSPINLMQGEYSAVEPGSHQRGWLRAAGLGAALVVLFAAHALIENQLLSAQAEQLDLDITAQFQQIFPEISRPARPRFQAEQAMAALSGSGSDAFLGITSRISQLVSGAGGVRIDSLNYANGQIRLSLKVPGTSDIEALQQQLRSSGLEVEVEQLQVLPDGPQAMLRIRPEGS